MRPETYGDSSTGLETPKTAIRRSHERTQSANARQVIRISGGIVRSSVLVGRYTGVLADPQRLAEIRRMPCMLAGHPDHKCSGGRIEAAHLGGGAYAPMCSSANRTGKYSLKNLPRTFWEHWGLDREEFVRKYKSTKE